MLTLLLRAALQYRAAVLLALLPLSVAGVVLALRMPIDVFPDLDRPRVVLLTECPGMAPLDVEAAVTQPMEAVLLGAPGVEAVRSQCGAGLAVTYVEFGWQVEPIRARQAVQERLATLSGLPEGVQPRMTPPASIMGQILHVGVRSTSAQRTPMELRTLVDWTVRPRLLREAGVAEVIVLGGGRKQYQVRVDATRLDLYGVTLAEVEAALRDNNLDAAGGFTDEGQTQRSIRIRGRLGPDPEAVLRELRLIPVKVHPHRSVTLGQVAEAVEAPAPAVGDASVDGHPAVVVTIVKQPHADTRAVTERIEAALEQLRLPDDVVIETDLFRLRGFIDRGIGHVGEALLTGAALVVLVLVLFLASVRTTLITLTAIPLSLVLTSAAFALIARLTGRELSINVMTLGGIAVAMGELVDDAIVDVENIFRRLRENRQSPQPRGTLRVVFDASREVRTAVVFGTAVVVLAFAPLFALGGVEGRLFVPLGVAYVVSILASLVVSLTVTPVLSYYLLGSAARPGAAERDSRLVRGLKWLAGFPIRLSLRHPGLLLLAGWVAAGLALAELSRMGRDFLPRFDEGSVQLNVVLPPGSSLRASREVGERVDAVLGEMPEVLHSLRRTGRAELDEHAEPVSRSEYILNIDPAAQTSRGELLRTLLGRLRAEIPGVEFEAEQPLAHLISHMLSGVNAQLAIKVFGDDLDRLQQLAREVQSRIRDLPQLASCVVDPLEQLDELHLVLRGEALSFYGLSRREVAELLQTALQGQVVSQVREGTRRFDLVLKLQDSQRNDPARLRDLRLPLPGGRGPIPLAEVVEFPEAATGPNQIHREDQSRRAVVRCNVQGDDLAGVVARIRARLRGLELPVGYSLEYGGQFHAQQQATRSLLLLGLASLLGVFATLYLLHPSLRVALQILNAVPMSMVGGVAALALTGQSLTVASLVGFVSLGGVAVRNGILLVTHYLHLMRSEGAPFSEATILRGSLERLVPVLMTALTAGVGLVPLVLGGQRPGLEILHPVATVMLGGLVTSTACEFLIHPGLFWRFSGPDAARLSQGPPTEEL